jgi:anti-anti-sigma factor
MEHDQPILDVEYGTDITIVTLNHEKILDEEQLRELQEYFQPIIKKNDNKTMIINFNNVKFMTSSFLGVLIRVHKKVRERGGRIELRNLDPRIRKIFEITQLTKVFDIS